MKRNVELKTRYPDLQQAHRVARELGAELQGVERQRDTYVRSRTGRLKLRQVWPGDSDAPQASPPTDTAHPAERAELIWYRRRDDRRPRTSDYQVIPVENGQEVRAVLCEALGVIVEVVKHRTIYLHDNVRIHIDDVAGLGTFLEFEAIVDDTCDDHAARAKIDRLRAAFGIADDQVVGVSYSDLACA